MKYGDESEATDDAYLDAVYDIVLERIARGDEVSAQEFSVGREHLESELYELVRLACDVSVHRPSVWPCVSGYGILSELGRGGMGTVYLARQERLGGRLVALKVAPAYAQHDPRTRARFLREARAMALVGHADIVEIFDVIESSSIVAYAMEWIDGMSLLELLGAIERPPRERSEQVQHMLARGGGQGLDGDPRRFMVLTAIAVARALEAVHGAGLLHRDVKPSNILLDREGVPHLADFGLVRVESDPTMTRRGALIGTEAYAAPEQLRGESMDARADVYGLGATLFHCLLGRSPGSLREPLRRSAEFDPWIPPDLFAIVRRALQPDANDRYANATELREDLERLMAFRPVLASEPTPWVRFHRFLRRHRRPIAWVLCTLIATLFAVGLLSFLFSWAAAKSSAELARARSQLIHPALTEALMLWSLGRDESGFYPGTASAAMQRYEAALAGYERALTLAPFDAALSEERDVVADAVRHWRGEDLSSAVPKRRLGRRSIGLMAYLVGDMDSCLQAWGSDLTRPGEDPLVGALGGLLSLEQGRPGIALSLLSKAAEGMPDSAELQVHVADAAVRVGWVDRARAAIDAARRMGAEDPFEQLLLVEADLMALEGQAERALERYARVVAHHRSRRARLHGGALQLHFGDAVTGLVWLGDCLGIHAVPEPWIELEVAHIVERWWGGLEASQRGAVLDRIAGWPPAGVAFDRVLLACARATPGWSGGRAGTWRVPDFFLESWGITNRAARPSSLQYRRPALAELRITREASRVRRVMKNLLPEALASWIYRTGYGLDVGARNLGPIPRACLDLGVRLAGAVAPTVLIPVSILLAAASPGAAQSILYRVEGAAAGDFFGVDVRGGGDIDGDGTADLVVGANLAAGGLGEVYVYAGATGALIRKHTGSKAGDRLGTSVAIVGDLNGDGRAEYVAGAHQFGIGGPGEAVVFDGATGSPLFPPLVGFEDGDALGVSCSALGDVNGDGLPEFLVGALQRTNQKPGYVLVADGATGAVLGAPLAGTAAKDEFGNVSGIGDVDSDGVPDFIASGTQAPSTGDGYARVYSGASRSVIRAHSGVANEQLGVSSAAAGDVDGDGVPDYVIGAWAASGPNGKAGAAFVYSGASGVQLHRFDGRASNDLYGLGVGGIGDYDGDGFDDLILGADQINNGGIGYSEVRSGLTGAVLLFARGELPGDRFGYRNRPLGDVDGDGRMDWATSSIGGDGAAVDSGWVEVVSGSCLPPAVYGTPKQNSLGCLPSIGFSGMPSASSPTAFDILASNELNFRNGLLFYGFVRAELPFSGGTLWVLPPLRRTTIQNAGGSLPPTQDCSGTFSFDFNAHAQSGLDPILAPGIGVYCQYWGRDPQQSDGTGSSLTAGLYFAFCP